MSVIGGRRDPWRMLINAAEALDEQRPGELRRPPAARRWVLGDPVTRDVEPGWNPDAVVGERIVEESRERERASGPANEPAVQADRHHLGRDIAFGVERIERILEIGVELIAGVEALRGGEAHIIG